VRGYDLHCTGNSVFAWGGSGFDGSVTADGAATVTCLGAPAANVYSMTRDCFFTALTVNNGVTVKAQNFAIFVQGTLTCNGTISNSGLPEGTLLDQVEEQARHL